MMNLEDYALDVGKSIEEIMRLCDQLDIPYQDATTTLTDEEIILLDNQLQDSEDYVEGDLSMDDDYEDDTYDYSYKRIIDGRKDILYHIHLTQRSHGIFHE